MKFTPLCLFLVGLLTPGSARAQEAVAPSGPLIDVLHYEIEAEVVPEQSLLRGEVQVRFRVLQDSLSVPFEINQRLSLLSVTGEDQIPYASVFDDFDSSRFRVRGEQPFRQGGEYTLSLRYDGILEREQYAFLDTPQTQRAMIDPNGAVLLGEGHWFPSHRLPLDAATVSLRFTVPLGFSVVAAGALQSIDTVNVNEVFHWQTEQPTGHVPAIVSRFFRQRFEELTIPVTFFVTGEFQQDPAPWIEAVADIMRFFQSEYGSYPAPALNLVQVGNVELPFSGCAGLLMLESPLLSRAAVPRMALARRLARHWWGCSVRPADPADAWLGDAFATYGALRYFEARQPEAFATELARRAVEALKYESKAPIRAGLELGMGSPEYESIVSSKGAWVLYMLSQLVGRDRFHSLMQEWLRLKGGQRVTTAEWVEFVKARTGRDYGWFFVQWVDQVGVPEFRVDYTIYKVQEGGFKIQGQVRQNLELFRMPLDLVIETTGEPEQKELNISGKVTSFTFQTETMPKRIEFDPHGKILGHSDRMKVAVHIALGEEYVVKEEFVAAIREYERAIQMNPRNSLAHFRLGEVFFEQQNLSSAANSFRDSLNGDLQPPWVETWSHLLLGKVYDVLGQRQRALAEYQKAINTKIDYNGAQAEAEKHLKEPYSKPSTLIG